MINTRLAGFLDLIIAWAIGLVVTTIAILITKRPLSTIKEKWTQVAGICLVSFLSAGFTGVFAGGGLAMIAELLFGIRLSEQIRWGTVGIGFVIAYIWGIITLTKEIFRS